ETGTGGGLLLLLLLAGWPTPTPTLAEPIIREFTLGFSAQGRPITVVQVGTGARKLVIVGDTHGGAEANTYYLTLELIEYFRANAVAVPPDVRLYLIPTINPDGLALGSRFDAFQVDLNRNMNTNLDDCADNDWRPTVFGAYGLLADTGGPFPDSQLENRVLRNFLLDASGAIFLHSNAGLVFPAFCDHAPSIEMAQVYANAAGYVYARYWPNYLITGGMHDWAGSMGIAAITPELISPSATEFQQNLAGTLAVLDAASGYCRRPSISRSTALRCPP
ncbi:MAG: peptidase M14, partial [Chloroflexaceae bacterium]|nr:peptidase M14 [Chloroflexaceae bacterium]